VAWLRLATSGGYFDPLSLADGSDSARTFKLKEAELKHGRLAMVAFLGARACFGPAWQRSPPRSL
jgi:hypothetical protein